MDILSTLPRLLLIIPVLKGPATKQQIGIMWAKPRAAPKKEIIISITASQRRYTFIPCTVISGGISTVTRDEAIAILNKPIDEAVVQILALAEKADKYDQLCGDISPTTPSGMTPVYLKPPPSKRKKKPGRKNGHREKVDDFKDHTLKHCPECHGPLKRPVKSYKRYIEDIPPVEPVVTEHTVY